MVSAVIQFFQSPGFIILAIILGSTAYVHFRGKVRFKFFRQLFDHSTFLAPINLLMYAFSSVPRTPYLSVSDVPSLKAITDNWQTIREEGLQLEEKEAIKSSKKLDDIGFNSFFRRGWKRFYVKWYGEFHPSALDACPKTIELIREVPGIKAAMFVNLPSGAKLPKHRDPYAGSLRYHLGLQTPNSEDCRIIVDGTPYHWTDGEAVLFDETYIHYAHNESDEDRVIFFCDVERPVRFGWVRWINRAFGKLIMAAATSPNQTTDKTGGINKIFGILYQQRILGKKLKAYNRTLYYIVKYILFGALFYWIFLSRYF
ncbi:MAG: aspartyl/asparaginyl beta-hydroxylase domain-containing protein [Bacteroidota bacterium]